CSSDLLAILLWAPHWVIAPQPYTDPVSGESISSPATVAAAMAGPVSYADAVEKAAPAVVNIYTRTLVRRERHPIFDDPLFQRFFGRNPEPDQRIQSSLGSEIGRAH